MRSQITPVILLGVLIGLLGHCPAGIAETMSMKKTCAGLSAPGHYPDYEPLPKYSIERHEQGSTTPPTLLLRIVVPTEALNGTSMTRIACKLAADLSAEHNIEALIFDDREAAKRFAPGFTDQRHHGKYLWHFKGRYTRNRNKDQNVVEFVIPELKDGLLGVQKVRITIRPSK